MSQLIPDDLLRQLPPIIGTPIPPAGDPTVYAKLFSRGRRWAFYLTAYDPTEQLCSGFIRSNPHGFACYYLDDLEWEHAMKPRIERARSWTPKPLSKCR